MTIRYLFWVSRVVRVKGNWPIESRVMLSFTSNMPRPDDHAIAEWMEDIVRIEFPGWELGGFQTVIELKGAQIEQ